jgi:3' terminal RNA ribose 2'-O-methyltransferase Hen1
VLTTSAFFYTSTRTVFSLYHCRSAKHTYSIRLLIKRYLKHQKQLTNYASSELTSKEEADLSPVMLKSDIPKIHDLRLFTARDALIASGAKRVVDLGCGEGKLIRLLLQEKQFDFILGMDVSYRSLEVASQKLFMDTLPAMQRARVELIHGSLTYRDQRLAGFDAATLIEVVEHLDTARLAVLEQVVFKFARPGTVIVTTPNGDYNVLFPDYAAGKMRHSDHRFEWSRAEFQSWASRVSNEHDYEVTISNIGEAHPELGALSQMAVFKCS